MTLEKFAKKLMSGDFDAELAELEKDGKEQAEYHHPLNMERAARYRALGQYNLTAVQKIRDLKAHFLSGQDKNVD